MRYELWRTLYVYFSTRHVRYVFTSTLSSFQFLPIYNLYILRCNGLILIFFSTIRHFSYSLLCGRFLARYCLSLEQSFTFIQPFSLLSFSAFFPFFLLSSSFRFLFFSFLINPEIVHFFRASVLRLLCNNECRPDRRVG